MAAPAQFGVWLVDLVSNGWYGGCLFDADGSGEYSREIQTAVGFPDNVLLSPVVYYRSDAGAGWGGDSGNCYDFAPATVTVLPFAVTGVEPAHAVAGAQVTIVGTGFTDGLNYVHFGANARPALHRRERHEIVAYVPAGLPPARMTSTSPATAPPSAAPASPSTPAPRARPRTSPPSTRPAPSRARS